MMTTLASATPRIAFIAGLALGVINPDIFGDRARRGLSVAETWMVRHNRALGVAVFFGFGTLFALRGLLALV
jgi:hypothetical protein